MEEIKNVTELMKRMKNPLDNEELYYKLFDIVYQSEGPGFKFSQIFNYDLNTEKKYINEYGLKANYSLMKMQISILIKHIEKMTENEFQNYITAKLSNRAPSQKKDKYIKYLQKLHDLTFDEWREILK